MSATVDPTEEAVARYMAAEDWLEDTPDDAWWAARSIEFREQYLASARQVIALVRPAIAHDLAEQQRHEMRAPGRSYDASRWNRCVDTLADSIDPAVSRDQPA